jgi:hypothetical protein
LLQDILLTLEI